MKKFENFINENKDDRNIIRTVVKDIIKIIKDKKSGDFYLPEDGLYNIPNILFNVELIIKISDIDGFVVNGSYSHDDVIELLIEYNKDYINIYDLIGELNDFFAHEITHMRQNYYGELNYEDVDKGSLEYYTRTHEIQAQYNGFKRLSKLRKLPLDIVVNDWFHKHRDMHGLTIDEENIVINKILNYENKIQ